MAPYLADTGTAGTTSMPSLNDPKQPVELAGQSDCSTHTGKGDQ